MNIVRRVIRPLALSAVAAVCANAAITPVAPEAISTANGTCYEIDSAEKLYGFAAIVNGTFAVGRAAEPYACGKLTADITVNSNVLNAAHDGVNAADSATFEDWTPIGNNNHPFKGKFNGQNHTISGLYINQSSGGNGLFGLIYLDNGDAKAEIQNVHILDSYMSGLQVGSILGRLGKTTGDHYSSVEISNVSSAAVVSGYDAGGIVGSAEAASLYIYSAHNTGFVDGRGCAGGILGDAGSINVQVVDSHNEGTIGNSPSTVGGIIGSANNAILNLSRVYNAGNVKSNVSDYDSYSGGFVGEVMGGEIYAATVYNVGTIEGKYAGGIAGNAQSISFSLENGFNGGRISGSSGRSDIWGKSFRASGNGSNFFYSSNQYLYHGESVSAEDFANGSVAIRLRLADGGKYWGQNVGSDPYPNFSNEITGVEKKTLTLQYDSKTRETFEYYAGYNQLPKPRRSKNMFWGWFSNQSYNEAPLTNAADVSDGATLYARWYQLYDPMVDADGCYAIGYPQHLFAFAAIVNGTYEDNRYPEVNACGKLTSNIAVNDGVLNSNGTLNNKVLIPWTPIGTSENPFMGSFDGKGFTISGLYFDNEFESDVGLFGYIENYSFELSPMMVSNVQIRDSYLRAKTNVGGLVGNAAGNVAFMNVGVEGTFVATEQPNYPIFISPDSKSSSETANYKLGDYNKNPSGGIVVGKPDPGFMGSAGIVGGLFGDVGGSISVMNAYSQVKLDGSTVGSFIGSTNSMYVGNSYSVCQLQRGGNCSSTLEATGVRDAFTENVYYLSDVADLENGLATAAQFRDGTVKNRLRNFNLYAEVDPSYWSQGYGKAYPDLNGRYVVLHYPSKTEIVEFRAGDDATLVSSITGGQLQGWYLNSDFSGEPITQIPGGIANGTAIYGKILEFAEPKLVNDCYEIATVGELYGFASIVNGGYVIRNGAPVSYSTNAKSTACGRLTADISVNANVLVDGALSGEASSFFRWNPIGESANKPFKGSFFGDGHVISGLYLNDASKNNVGLFGFVSGTNTSRIEKLGVENSYMHAGSAVGGIVGTVSGNANLYVTNAFARGSFGGNSNVGGIIGSVLNGGNIWMSNSYADAAVQGEHHGGLIGSAQSANVENSFYLQDMGDEEMEYGSPVSEMYFTNGIAAKMLHKGVDGSIWGQNVNEGELYPNFSGVVVGANSFDVRLVLSSGVEENISYIEGDNIELLPMFKGDSVLFWSSNEAYTDRVAFGLIEIVSDTTLYAMSLTKNGDCYEIDNANELLAFSFLTDEKNDACGKVTNDIEFNKNLVYESGNLNNAKHDFKIWKPIGGANESLPFAGTFDGQGHTISGLYVNDESADGIGLFGAVSGVSPVVIKNVSVVESYFKGHAYVGGLAGMASGNVKILNAGFEGTLIAQNNHVGGLVGSVNFAQLTASNAFARVKVIGNEYMGGFFGSVYASENFFELNVSNSYSASCLLENANIIGLYGYLDPNVKKTETHLFTLSDVANELHGKVTTSQFGSGAVAAVLHDFNEGDVNGSVWGQDRSKNESYPNLSGAVVNGPTKKTVTLHYGDNDEVTFEYYQGLDMLPVPMRKGRAFAGWYMYRDYIGKAYARVPNVNTVYAKWADKVLPMKDSDNCYKIEYAADLYGFAAIVNGTFAENRAAEPAACGKLIADISVNSDVLRNSGTPNENYAGFARWMPIGMIDGEDGHPFTGTFDGQGHTISGLYFDYPSVENVGLFGVITGNSAESNSAVIRNLRITDSYFYGENNVGLLAGLAVGDFSIQKTGVEGSVIAESGNVGGFIGFANTPNAAVENSYSRVKVTGDKVGGIAGNVGVQGFSKANLRLYNSYSVCQELKNSNLCGQYGYVELGASALNFNSFFLSQTADVENGATTTEQFADGTVVHALHNFNGYNVNGSVWGQDLKNREAYPNLNGTVVEIPFVTLHYGSDDDRIYKYYPDQSRKLPVPSVDAKIFRGWYQNSDYSGDILKEIPENIEDGTVFYAKWLEITEPQLVNDCYEITTAGDLYGFAAIVNGGKMIRDGNVTTTSSHAKVCGRLKNDITINNNVLVNGELNSDAANFVTWAPIGLSSLDPFGGSFYGDGHVISGLYYDNGARDYIGLFGFVANSSSVVIKDVGIVDSYMHGGRFVGGLVAYNDCSYLNFSNVFVRGVFTGYSYVAGLVGYSDYGNSVSIRNSYAAGTFQGSVYYDGLVAKALLTPNVVNSFYRNDAVGVTLSEVGTPVEEFYFANGVAAKLLHKGTNGSIWGQNVLGGDLYPNFSGSLMGVIGAYDVNLVLANGETQSPTYVSGENFSLPTELAGDEVLFWSTDTSYAERVSFEKFTTDKDVTLYGASLTKKNDCYEIDNANELLAFSYFSNENKNICGKLTDNIVFNENVLDADGKLNGDGSGFRVWRPIGLHPDYFNGLFDGQGYTISGLYFNDERAYEIGLFGFTVNDPSVTIKNLKLTDFYFSGNSEVGGLVGRSFGALDILNVGVEGTLVSKSGVAGGLVAEVSAPVVNVANSYSRVNIQEGKVESYTGGLIGISQDGGEQQASAMLVKVVNSYSASRELNSGKIWGWYGNKTVVENWMGNGVLVLSDETDIGKGQFTEEQFASGFVAYLLHTFNFNGVSGSVWGQNVGTDAYPTLNIEITGVEKKTFTLHYADNDEKTFVYYKGINQVPTPTRDASLFLGWYLNGNFSGGKTNSEEASDGATLYAKWLTLEEPQKVNGCYEIGSVAELYGFAAIVNGTFDEKRSAEKYACGKLVADITVNSNVLNDAGDGVNVADSANFIPWIPIKKFADDIFTGGFDGQMHTLSGLYLNDESLENGGLFGRAGEFYGDPSEIKNLKITDSYFKAANNVGALVGVGYGPLEIANVAIENTIIQQGDNSIKQTGFAGGIVGLAEYSIINVVNTYSQVKLAGTSVGGLVGGLTKHSLYNDAYSVNIFNSYSTCRRLNDESLCSLVGVDADFENAVNADNSFFLSTTADVSSGAKTMQLFADGSVATALHNYQGNNVDGSIWGQIVGEEDFPNFGGSVVITRTVTLHYAENDDRIHEYKHDSRTLPIPSADGKIFRGWFMNSDYSGEAVTEIPLKLADEAVIYAKWFEKTVPPLVNNCYEITTAGDLYGFAAVVNGTMAIRDGAAVNPSVIGSVCGRLKADITVNDNVLVDGALNDDTTEFLQWAPIGTQSKSFKGTFYGDGHVISGLYVNDESLDNAGLFGYAGGSNMATIENLGVVNSYVHGGRSVGGLAGTADNASFVNVFVNGNVSGSSAVGAIAGTAGAISVMNCYATGTVEGTENYGGLFGYAQSLYSQNCFYPQNMTGDAQNDFGTSVAESSFANGVVAKFLHNGESGSIWGQNVTAGDVYPNFSGKVTGDVGSFDVKLVLSSGVEVNVVYADGIEFNLPTKVNRDTVLFWSSDAANTERITEPFSTDKNTTLYALSLTKSGKYFEIDNADELMAFSTLAIDKVDICGRLTTNIVFNEHVLDANGNLNGDGSDFRTWVPIGWFNEKGKYKPFEGSFDGQGYTISGLYVNDVTRDQIGLFGYVGGESSLVTIKNVKIVDSYFNVRSWASGVIASAMGKLEISNVGFEGTLSDAANNVGGFISQVFTDQLNIVNSYSKVKILNSGTGNGGMFSYVGTMYNSSAVDIVNFYSVCFDADGHACASFGSVNKDVVKTETNVFYLSDVADASQNLFTAEPFENGIIASFLHNYNIDGVDGSIWGQNVTGGDRYPNFSGRVTGGTSAKTVVLHYDDYYEVPFEYFEGHDLLPIPSEGFFIGWYLDAEFSGEPVSSVPSDLPANSKLYARWINIRVPQVVDGCYGISSVDDLYSFAAIVNGELPLVGKGNRPLDCARLMADITVNRNVLKEDGSLSKNAASFVQWTPIGIGFLNFEGTFDGQGHTISGLYFNNPFAQSAGLFGSVSSGNVKNLKIKDSYFLANVVGMLVGQAEGSMNIREVGVEGTAVSSSDKYSPGVTGGLLGLAVNPRVNIVNSYTLVHAAGDYVGGLFGVAYGTDGDNYFVNVSNSYSACFEYCNENAEIYVSLQKNNTFVLSQKGSLELGYATLESFSDGTVANLLHNYSDEDNGVDGSIWGQRIGVDAFPSFVGSVGAELVLDWKTAADIVSLADSSITGKIVSIAAGKKFYSNGTIYEGTLSAEQIAAIGSGILYPISGVEMENNGKGFKVTIDGSRKAPLVIATDIEVAEVEYTREFTPGVFSTMTLPFEVEVANVQGAQIGVFNGIKYDEELKVWYMSVRRVKAERLQANYPYMIYPEQSKVTIGGGAILNSMTTQEATYENWHFVPNYEVKSWNAGDPEIGYAYGIAGRAVPELNIHAGDFVKVAAGASVAPTRGYLLFRKGAQGVAPGKNYAASYSLPAADMPEVLKVKFEDEEDDAENVPMVIGTVDARTGKFGAADHRWFDMKGRLLDVKPTQKGVYYHNGKRVVIK